MNIFNTQMANVIEWNESRDDVLFWMWRNKEIKKGSRLIIRPGQDAIFLYNGKIEGVFTDEGNYEIESEIVPFLTTLKGYKFGFNTPLRAEVLFINTKEFLIRWGTKNAIMLQTPNLKGGLPIRSYGTFTVRIDDHQILIDKIAGIKQQFTIDDVKERTLSMLDVLLMKWITREGKDLFNLQLNALEIARGIREDLDMELIKIGLTITDFMIASFTYPENIQRMIEKTASFDMIEDLDKYQKVSLIDSMANHPNSTAPNMIHAGAQIALGGQLMNQLTQTFNENQLQNQPKTTPTNQCLCCHHLLMPNAKFCPECGAKVVPTTNNPMKYCSECGNKIEMGAKFCNECGTKLS